MFLLIMLTRVMCIMLKNVLNRGLMNVCAFGLIYLQAGTCHQILIGNLRQADVIFDASRRIDKDKTGTMGLGKMLGFKEQVQGKWGMMYGQLWCAE